MSEEEFYLEDLRSKFKKINPNDYYLSYSGGKDSHFLFWFIKEYAPEFKNIEVVGVNTYMEHHEILQRIFKNCDRVLRPTMKPFEIKEKYGIPCFSKQQDEYIKRYQTGHITDYLMTKITGCDKDGNKIKTYFKLNNKARDLLLSGKLHKVSNMCCKVLKKDTLHRYEKETKKKAILGIRSAEGKLRATQYKTCFTKDRKFTPIHDLSDELLERIIKKYNIEVPKVYEHIERTGCMGCPYGSFKGDTEKELALINENQRKFVCEYFKESYEVLGINTERQMTIDDFK